MTKTPGPGARGLRFIGGLILGFLILGGAGAYFSLTAPIPEREALAEAETPAQEGEQVAVIPDPEVAPTDPALPEPVPQPSAEVNRSVRGAIEPSQPAEDGRFAAPEPFETPVTDGQFAGLPPASQLEGPAPVAEIPEVEDPAFELQGPALDLNAVAFEPRGGLPLIAVILDDAGESALSSETLLSLSMPLTLGIAPRSEEDVMLASEAKLANYEVLAQLPIGTGETALITPEMSDLEVAEQVESLMANLWMSVGAAGVVADGGPLDERIMRGVITVLERNGFAFVNTDAQSLEAGRAFAQAFSVAYAGQTSRIPADASPADAYAALDAAAAAAAEQGGVAIVSGPATREMLEGLLRWGLEKGGRAAQLAPVSAVIKRMNQS